MRLPIGFAVILSIALIVERCPAQMRTTDTLQRYSSADVILLTTSPEHDSRAMLKAVGEAASFFAQGGFPKDVLPSSAASDPVKIFAFASKEEYVQFRLTNGSFGHYIHSERGDFVVLQDISPKHREAGLHEYMHAVVRRAGLKLPVWLNEGLADVYSTLATEGDHVSVGRQIASRMKALEHHSWLNLPVLMDLCDERTLYRSSEQTSIFYGESWALTHMLVFSTRYGPNFPQFLKSMGSGLPVLQALSGVYGIGLTELNADLQRYWEEGRIHGFSIKMKIDVPGQPPLEPLDPLQSSLELATLLAAAPAKAIAGTSVTGTPLTAFDHQE